MDPQSGSGPIESIRQAPDDGRQQVFPESANHLFGRALDAYQLFIEGACLPEIASHFGDLCAYLSPEAVAAELQNGRAAIGRSEDVARFFHASLQAANVPVRVNGKAVTVHLSEQTPRSLRQAVRNDEVFTGRFDLPLQEGELYLGRTSPLVEGLASWTLDQALDSVAREGRPIAARCGFVRTSEVGTRTSLLFARFRYHLQTTGDNAEAILCEEIVPLAFTGTAEAPRWLDKP